MQLFTNNAISRLAAGISDVALTLQVESGEGSKFPNPTGGDYFLATLSKISSGIESDIEIVKVTARSGDGFIIVRAQEGTTAKVYAAGDSVQLRMTAATANTVESHLNNTSNPHSVTKTQVGLGNVDNTSDANKPVSTAQQTALNAKLDKTGGTVTGNITTNAGTESKTVLQVSGVTQAEFQANGSATRLSSTGTNPLSLSTNAVDRVTIDSTGNVTVGSSSSTGVFKVQGSNTGDLAVFESTDAAASGAPDVVLYRNSASPAASDQLGVVIWRGKDSGANDHDYAREYGVLTDPTNLSEDAELVYEVSVNGTLTERLRLTSAGASVNGTLSATTFSGAGTSLTGTASGLTVGNATAAVDATNATNVAITNDAATASSVYLTWVGANSGNQGQKTTSSKLSFVPSTGVLSATSFSGAGTGLTGTAASLTAGTASKATNLSGGNGTTLLGSIAYQSGTDTTTLLSPNITAGKMFLSQTGTGTNGAAPSWSSLTKSDVGLSNVEDTALSTWAGSTNITTVGTIAAGTWNGTAIADGKIASALTGKTYNALSLTANATGFQLAGGTTSKTLVVSNTLTLAGTDGSTLNIGSGGTLGSAAFTASTAYQAPIGTISGLAKGNGANALTAATAGTDYVAPGTTSTFSVVQNFTASGITLKGSSTGTTTFASANASATNYTITFPAVTSTLLTNNNYSSGLSTLVANSANTPTVLTAAAGQSIRVNAGGTAWEAYTPSAGGSGDVVAANNNTLTGANSFQNVSGQTFLASTTTTQDGLILTGRAGGSTSLRVTLSPGTLTASRSVTFPDAAGAVVIDAATQTLTNKTLTTPVLSATGAGTTAGQLGYSGGVVTFGNGSATRTVQTLEDAQTVSGAKTFTGANSFQNATGQTFLASTTTTQDGIILTGRAGGSTSLRVTLSPGTLTASRAVTFPDAAGAIVLDTATQTLTNKTLTTPILGVFTPTAGNTGQLGFSAAGILYADGSFVRTVETLESAQTVSGAKTFTAANSFQNATGQTFLASTTTTQDGIVIVGRAGGASSFRATIQPPTLTASRTLTLPDATGTLLVSGGLLGTPSNGDLSNCTADGTNAVGFRHIPQNSQSAAYTLVLTDAGRHILHPSTDSVARTFTIPANSSVAFAIGTAITFVNQNAAGVVTIAITTDTMRLAGAGTTGSRTLAANGVATAIKIGLTEWIISGTGLT